MSASARYADVFAALSSEPRLDIMRLLFAAYPQGMTVGELQAQLQIPNSTLSHHLEKLRVEGLVVVQRDRQFLRYSANTAFGWVVGRRNGHRGSGTHGGRSQTGCSKAG